MVVIFHFLTINFQRYESWESEKTLDDMEVYEWEKNLSYKNVINLLKQTHPELDISNLQPEWQENLNQYKEVVESLFNDNKGMDFTLHITQGKYGNYKALSLQSPSHNESVTSDRGGSTGVMPVIIRTTECRYLC